MSHKNDLEELITNHKLRLQKLKEQKALDGISADPKISIEIEKIEAEIEKLEAELKKLSGVGFATLTGRLVNRNALRVLPLVVFTLVLLTVGYLVVKEGSASSEGEATIAETAMAEASATAAAKATEVTQAAMAEASKTAEVMAAAEKVTADANATAAAKSMEIAQTATAEASATTAKGTEMAKIATAEAQQETEAIAAAEKATAEASATAAAKATEVAQTATAEAKATEAAADKATAQAIQTATAAAQTATAEANARATAKALTPTATSTPKSDAVVAASGNVVLLRSGPGPDYESLATLSAGTALDVLRWVHNKEEWIKVAANPDSGERIEGYVNIASGYIKVNVDLKDFPPIYEYGPALYEPERFESRGTRDFITFKWQEDYAVLEEHQYYSLILVRDDLEDEDACYHWQTKETEMTVRPEDYGCGGGAYHWGVGIATDLAEGTGNERVWRDDSERDERFPLGLDIPHPDAPSDGGGGGDDKGDAGEGGVDL